MTSLSSAEKEIFRDLPEEALSEAAASQWKQEANHRLAAHRARRSGRSSALQNALPGMEEASEATATAGAARGGSVADRVAARYAKAPTYSEMLAAEARNVARAAEAAALAAGEARNAAQAILIGLDADAGDFRDFDLQAGARDSRAIDASNRQTSSTRQDASAVQRQEQTAYPGTTEAEDDATYLNSDQDEALIPPVQPLAANLLEFPRQLVATRRARPRIAEGPLREEYDRDDAQSQLRIFEVGPETISTDPVVEPVISGWASIRLDSQVDHQADAPAGSYNVRRKQSGALPEARNPAAHTGAAKADFDLPLQTASLEDRLMAGLFDAALVAAGFLVFVLIFVACTAHPPLGKPAVIAAVVALFVFSLIYELLFFSFGSDTPGMRYAKIALCTFDDENPTRTMMRRRLGALLLSASPLGLGILWAIFDDDRLGWHDRISRTYQRSYR